MKKIIRSIIIVVIYFTVAYILCLIKPATEYSWFAAIWHGVFFFPNFVLHCINNDILFYSELPSTAYKIFFCVGVAIGTLIGEIIKIIGEVLRDSFK